MMRIGRKTYERERRPFLLGGALGTGAGSSYNRGDFSMANEERVS